MKMVAEKGTQLWRWFVENFFKFLWHTGNSPNKMLGADSGLVLSRDSLVF
uniref:Uncharacterized protein n=1 Tax=Arundo donax TaxID=35708 RepID=A0A0A9ABD6_ARUDO